jgi:hypothetical protein
VPSACLWSVPAAYSPFVDIYTKPIEKLTLDDIDEFLMLDDDEVHRPKEGLRVDYKQEPPDDLARVVAAFANAAGGVVILGVVESDLAPVRRDGFKRKGQTKTRISNMISNKLLAPRPAFEVQVFPIPGSADHDLVVVRVPQSDEAPHMHVAGTVPVRVADNIVAAHIPEIERLLRQRDSFVHVGDPSGDLPDHVFVRAMFPGEAKRARSETFLHFSLRATRARRQRLDAPDEVQLETIFREEGELPYQVVARRRSYIEWRHDDEAADFDRHWIATEAGALGYRGQVVRRGSIFLREVIQDLHHCFRSASRVLDHRGDAGRVEVGIALSLANLPIETVRDVAQRDLLGVSEIERELVEGSDPYVTTVDASTLEEPGELIADALFDQLRCRGARVNHPILLRAVRALGAGQEPG